MGFRLRWAPLLVLVSFGCARPAALWLTIEAPFQVPDECDELKVSAYRPDAELPVWTRRYPLPSQSTFPFTLSLQTKNAENLGEGRLAIEVEALREGSRAAPWAIARTAVSFDRGRTQQVTVTLCDCAGGFDGGTPDGGPPPPIPPIARAGDDVTAPTLTPIVFDGSASSDPDGTLSSLAWDFGDSTIGSGVSLSHAYALPGQYTATLTVTDHSGLSAQDTRQVTVTNQSPTADAGGNLYVERGVVATFHGSGQDVDGTIAAYVWDFGDGTVDAGADVTHAYADAGIYTATLTVTDNLGATGSATRRVWASRGRSVPDDPMYRDQWSRAAIRTAEAWAATTGAVLVKVAIVDTGVTPSPELDRALLPGVNLLDGGSTDDDAFPYGKGTQLAGLIAAETDNDAGIAGVASNVKLLPVRVADPTALFDHAFAASQLARGLVWAADAGADIVVTSFALPIATLELFQAAAELQARGIPLIASSGTVKTQTSYPAMIPGVVAVGSVNAANRVEYSGEGFYLGLVAPGEEVLTTTLTGCCMTRSFSTIAPAYVAGALAILMGEGIPATESLGYVLAGARDLGDAGWDPSYGAGVIDACAAVAASGRPCPTFIDSLAPTAPAGLTILPAGSGSSSYLAMMLDWTSSSDDVGVVAYDIFRDGTWVDAAAPRVGGVRFSSQVPSPNTQYCYYVRARDAAGNSSLPSTTECQTSNP